MLIIPEAHVEIAILVMFCIISYIIISDDTNIMVRVAFIILLQFISCVGYLEYLNTSTTSSDIVEALQKYEVEINCVDSKRLQINRKGRNEFSYIELQ